MAEENDLYLLSDEPYIDMVWQGEHRSIIQEEGMLERSIATYTMSKSFSMSGFRLGYSLTSPEIAEVLGKLINTNLSCTAPFIQEGGRAALLYDEGESRKQMAQFKRKVEILAKGLNEIPEVSVKVPRATFYVFANFKKACNRLGIVSHGLALFLLEAADDKFGVACLGGECFGTEGQGFLRFSCAQPDEKMLQAVEFISEAIKRSDRASAYLKAHPDFALKKPYAL
jgi:aspartate aminotransferase